MPRRVGVAALLAAVSICAAGQAVAPAAPAAKSSVKISGRAYAFNHMDTFIAGATIRVRELPDVSATTDANGDYVLKVPDETTVTPYIDPPPGYHQIDLQTFHTRGEPIKNANFQTPADFEYNALAALLTVQLGPDGRPAQCAIVTTASARNVRGVDYATFEERTPHGVPGATAHGEPALPQPTYFNENVIPDSSETETSGDGGIIWTEVPAGAYRVIAESASTRFASFLATCEPGRIVNANPPWGAYELTGKEKPLAAGTVAGSIKSARPAGPSDARVIPVVAKSAEVLRAKLKLSQHGKTVGTAKTNYDIGRDKVPFRVADSADKGPAALAVTLIDAAGDRVTERFRVKLPALLPGR